MQPRPKFNFSAAQEKKEHMNVYADSWHISKNTFSNSQYYILVNHVISTFAHTFVQQLT